MAGLESPSGEPRTDAEQGAPVLDSCAVACGQNTPRVEIYGHIRVCEEE